MVRVQVLFTIFFVLEVLDTHAIFGVFRHKSHANNICALTKMLSWEIDSMISKWRSFGNFGAINDQLGDPFTFVIDKDIIWVSCFLSQRKCDLNLSMEVVTAS